MAAVAERSSQDFGLERSLFKVEYYLSEKALYPGIGILPGIFKVGLGVIQTIAAIAVAIFYTIPGNFDTPSRNRAFSHIVHGLANIIAGTFEAIPIIGSIVFFLRCDPPPEMPLMETGQNNRFLKYDCLLDKEHLVHCFGKEENISIEVARNRYGELARFNIWSI